MTKSILIIDDEEHIRRMMRITLESAGYKIGDANDGHEGLKLFGNGSSWDAVILDQRMPGMDGIEALKRIKEADPEARIIMATAYASIELAVDAMKLGASDFVRKPMTPEILRNVVSAALTKKKKTPTITDEHSTPATSVSPDIETITMNGFSILDSSEDDWKVPDQRRFVVVTPAGTRHDVLVQIDEAVVGYVERLTHRRLNAESSFWTEQARRLLGDHLWKEGEVPRTRKLTLSVISREKLLIAERWKDETPSRSNGTLITY